MVNIEKTKFEGIYFYWKDKKKILLTKNLTPSKKYFNEDLISENNIEYREFDVRRSKLASAVLKGINFLPFKQDSIVLYLGASYGYTSSYVSDICNNGFIFALDFAPRVLMDLYFLCKERENMTCLLYDANQPELYKDKIIEVDIIYQDIAQKNQVEIFLKNIARFLKKKGYCIIAIKARSIDTLKKPDNIYKEVEKELEKNLRIIDKIKLDPFQKDHCFFVCQKK